MVFIMIEGLDGSGKGVIIDTVKEFLSNKRCFDTHNFNNHSSDITCDKNIGVPSFDEIKDYEVLFTHEPSNSLVGMFVREFLIKKGSNYDKLSAVHAFALDREITYRTFIIEALSNGKIIVQDRGVLSSLVYQSLQTDLTMEEIAKVPGNKLALYYPPDYIFITKVNPNVVMARLNSRKKKDHSMFEELEFQKKLDELYINGKLKEFFPNTSFIYIDTNPPRTEKDTKNQVLKELKKIFV